MIENDRQNTYVLRALARRLVPLRGYAASGYSHERIDVIPMTITVTQTNNTPLILFACPS